MDDQTLSTPNNLDDNIVEEQNADSNEDENQVESPVTEETTTDESEYDKAWKTLDKDEIPDEIFGETTAPQEPSSETNELEPVVEEQVKPQEGLVITNPILRHNGRDIPVDSEEELLRLAQQGLDYNIKSGKLKKAKPFVSLVDQGLTVEMAKAVVDLINGNHGALDYIKQQAGIKEDTSNDGIFGYDEPQKKEEEYKPEVKAEDPVMEFFNDVSSNYPELGAKVSTIYAEIDDGFKTEVYTPQTFSAFVQSISTGEFEKVYPLAIKARAINPALSWLEAYKYAGQKLAAGSQPDQKEAVQPPNGTSAPQSKKTDRSVNKLDYDSAFNMDMSELEERLFSS